MEMEHLGFKVTFIWDVGNIGSSYTHYTTTSDPIIMNLSEAFLTCACPAINILKTRELDKICRKK